MIEKNVTLVSLVVVLTCLGCPSEENIRLEVALVSDFAPFVDFQSIEITVDGQTPLIVAPRADINYVSDQAVVAEFAELAASSSRRVELRLLGREDQVISAGAKVFVHEGAKRITFSASRICQNITCATGETCQAGVCIGESCEAGDARAECQDLPSCDDVSCNESQLCGRTFCFDGACFVDVSQNSCADEQRCDAVFGCVENGCADATACEQSSACLQAECLPSGCTGGACPDNLCIYSPSNNGQTCDTGGMCSEGLCVEVGAGCSDGELNQDESDIDCGGVCGASCDVGEACVSASDCSSGYCGAGGVCAAISSDCQMQTDIPASECAALQSLFLGTTGSGWNNASGWAAFEIPPCQWFGVACTSGRVTTLRLENNNLVGPFPSELFQLTELTDLDVSGNELVGSLPNRFDELPQLTCLEIRTNPNVTGTIPDTIFTLTKLRELYLGETQLSGTIPPEIGNLRELQIFRTSGIDISGPLPSEIGQCTQLRDLFLANNNLTGPLPEEIGNLTQLRTLSLINSEMTGLLPSSLGNLVGLQGLALNNNSFTGTIPSELGSLTSLTSLSLSGNELSGLVPATFQSLASLTSIDLCSQSGALTSDGATGAFLRGIATTDWPAGDSC